MQGVEVRKASIRITFTFEGKQRHETLMVGAEPAKPTPANVKWAGRIAAEIRDRIKHGTFVLAEYFPASGTTAAPLDVGAQLDAWMAAQRVEFSTRAGYESAVKFWKAALPLKPLKALKHSDVLTALADKPHLSGKTVNNYVSVLRQAVALAVSDKLLTDNPVASVPRAAHQKEPPDPFSAEEAEAIISDMVTHYPEPVANMVEWRFFVGVRTSEMAGLRWGQVDLASGYMQIREAIVRGQDKATTKTATARDVILNSRALAALQRQRKHTQMAGEYVWLDPRYGTPWREERAFRRSYWEPSLKRLSIRYRPPNNMRHSYATRMLMAGMRPAFCAKQLGHSVEMFLRVYSKWLDGSANTAEMERLEAAMRPAIPKLYPEAGK